jgi:hypothetical protein
VVVLAPDHVEAARLTNDVDAPTGVALTDGALLVADKSHTDRGRVIEFPLDDRPR